MPVIFNKFYPMRALIFFIGEGVLIGLSLLAVNYWLQGSGLFWIDFQLNVLRTALVAIIFQLCLYFFDLYDQSSDLSMPNTVSRMTQAFGVGCIILGLLYYAAPILIISAKIFWGGYLCLCLLVFIWRNFYYLILRRRWFVQNVILVGTGKFACEIAREIEGRADSVYRIKFFVGDTAPSFNPNNAPVVDRLDRIEELVRNHEVERIIVALDDKRGHTPVDELLRYKLSGIIIDNGLSFFERITGRVLVDRMVPSWIIYSHGFSLSRFRYQLKRLADLFFAGILLLLSWPLFLITAILIKIESKGPVFYIQERVGEKDCTFRLLKFRSMREDAEKDSAVWARENDDRITRVGKFIRNTRIDELPQLLNVLKGEMSLVGPRPERRVFVDQLMQTIPYYTIRHELKPGLTGWAQVCYRYGASEVDALKKLEYDLYYMKNFSIALDLLIIFRTIKTVLFQQGAR